MMNVSARMALSTYTLPSAMAVSKGTSNDESSSSNPFPDDLAKPYDWRKIPSEPDHVRTSLGCLFFSDLGCDAECFIVTSAYDLLGTGICDNHLTCVCNFTRDITLDGMWHRKFKSGRNEFFLQQIKNDIGLSKKVHEILLDPFQTGEQIKKRLIDDLGDDIFHQLQVTDESVASKIFPTHGTTNQEELKKHIDSELPKVTSLSKRELSDFNFDYTLRRILKDPEQDENRCQQLVKQIRRIGNESLNSILVTTDYYDTLSDLKWNEKNTYDTDRIIDKVIDTLVKKTDEMVFKKWASWFGNTITFWIFAQPASSRYDFGTNKREVMVDKKQFKVPPKIYKELLQQSKQLTSFGTSARDTKYKFRYQKLDKDTVNLNWIRRSMWFCTFQNSSKTVNQIWRFGFVIITISVIPDNYMAQYWNFGTYNYQFLYYRDASGNGLFRKEWSDGTERRDMLNRYKKLIQEWCKENENLIDADTCTIYKKEKEYISNSSEIKKAVTNE